LTRKENDGKLARGMRWIFSWDAFSVVCYTAVLAAFYTEDLAVFGHVIRLFTGTEKTNQARKFFSSFSLFFLK
jgi:hypothetical protein